MKKETDNVLLTKSYKYAIRIVNTYKYLIETKHEYVLSKQLLRSGTSIGANAKEAVRGQSTADFIAKLNISLKEASETEYWLSLLHDTGYLNDIEYNSLNEDCKELLRLLTSIINTSKKNNKL